MYSIIDIETTGGNNATGKITEIAIYIFDGEKIVDEYSTLINPERSIPYHISRLTGITDDMVVGAPKFYEVARKIVEMTEDTIFVAHNVSFDYNFIRKEFRDLGYNYFREKLCTVKLSRKLIPGQPSYSLGKLCRALNIPLEDRHRAAGDAKATVRLFELLLREDIQRIIPGGARNISLPDLHPDMAPDELDKLPQKTGVYYLYNNQGELLYIGKSKNIRSRVLSHLTAHQTKKAREMKTEVAAIDFELTGSELVALLKESHEIKQFRPPYNVAQRRNNFKYGIYEDLQLDGYLHLSVGQNSTGGRPLASYGSKGEAERILLEVIEKYHLCQKLCGFNGHGEACFPHRLKQCSGACLGEEDPEAYNQRVNAATKHFHFDSRNLMLIDKGRNPDEAALVLIEDGCYSGYGFVDRQNSFSSAEDVKDSITTFPDNRDVRQIIRSFLSRNRVEKVIRF